MASRTQATRLLAINTPLGPDKLLARSASIREVMSQPFQIDMELLSEDHEVKFDAIVGQPVTLRLNLANGAKRYFQGFVSEFSYEGVLGELAIYRARIVPWLWFLSRTSNCRIFQDQSAIDAVEKVFSDHSTAAHTLGLSSDYKPKEYQVQYRETDLNFISRLLEKEGVAYFFLHDDKQHTMVLADNPGAYSPFEGYEKIRFDRGGFDRGDETERINEWSMTSIVRPTSVELTDYDFKVPEKDLLKKHVISRKYGMADKQIFDYPADAVMPDEVESYAKIRTQELQATQTIVTATGNARGLALGHTFELTTPPRKDLAGKKWLIIAATHRIESDDYQGAAQAAASSYQCSFTAIESTTHYRPPRTSVRPTIVGPQTAIVVGRSGDEITVDEHARVKVRFHWDRFAKGNETDSCWVRVSQAWAGKSWGAIFIPRHGHEVIVEFLEGDPDKPIITGSVYNGRTRSPYDLPASKNISSVKSDSTKGSGGFNEIKFDDTKGSELVYIQAEKDRTALVKHNNDETVQNNESLSVGVDRTKSIGKNESTTVGENRTESVGKDENITIGMNRVEAVGVNETITIGANRTETVGANEAVTIGASRALTIAIADAETVGLGKALTVGAAYQITVGAAMNTTVGGPQMEEVGTTKTIIVGDKIEIKCGSSSLTMDKSGNITLKGKEIKFVASGDVVAKGSKIKLN